MTNGWTVLRHAIVLAALAIMVPGSAMGDGRTQFLIDRLKYPRNDDFRVRTNAALQLGATGDGAAVQPLCGALDDPSDVVRSAAAVALKRLGKPDAVPCLKAHQGTEKSDQVKLQISRALEGFSAGGGGSDDVPKLVPSAKYYVAISPVTNQTGRPQADIERIVGGAIRAKFGTMGDYQLAPRTETSPAAKAVIAKRKFKGGYYLAVVVDAFDYSNGNLRVSLKLAVSSYPGKDLKGEVGPLRLTQTGIRSGDHGAEDGLLGMAAGKAVEQFSQYFR